jgi:DNA-binding response OmpR family regulator
MQPVVGKPHILVIEYNLSDVVLLKYARSGAGLVCQFTIIDDGADAVALFRQHTGDAEGQVPDLVILDLNLPKYGGLEILQQMRANQTFAQVPVVVLSSSTSSHERAIIEKFGIRKQIVKSIDLKEFLKIGPIIKELLAECRTPG